MSTIRRHLIRDDDRDAGYVALLVALLMPVLIMLAAFSVDVARWYVAGEDQQRAADAAALAGVPFIPQDFAKAKATALDYATRNGYPADKDTVIQVCSLTDTYSSNGAAVSSDCQTGLTNSQLRVSISYVVPNIFASFIGINTTTITRSGTSDYTGPAPMGSPCNVFGNEPAASSAPATVISSLSNCGRNPQFWANAHGPNVYKVQGDQYDSRWCSGVESGCSGTSANSTNTEYRKDGVYYVIRVLDPDKTGPITVQLYDPAFVNTGDTCSTATGLTGVTNKYTSDAAQRYRADSDPILNALTPGGIPTFCAGDNWNGDSQKYNKGVNVPTVTSFGLRAPTNTADPSKATPVGGTCTRQFHGFDTPKASDLQGKDNELTQSFHQWVSLCTINAPVAGDYYLQVRTNVAYGNDMYSTGADDMSVAGNGSNRFGIRVLSSDGTQVSAAGWERMPIFANSKDSDTTFNLIRIMPGARGKFLKFTFFDVGDASAAAGGTVTMRLPVKDDPNNNVSLQGCTLEGHVTRTAEGVCSISGIKNTLGWDGQSQTMTLRVPQTYDCVAADPSQCWFRVEVNFNGGGVTDATTWTATIDDDPVRLVQ